MVKPQLHRTRSATLSVEVSHSTQSTGYTLGGVTHPYPEETTLHSVISTPDKVDYITLLTSKSIGKRVKLGNLTSNLRFC